jgi:flagellar secretion chaperone FliS
VTTPYDSYVENSILTATPLQLVSMLYCCAIDSVSEARRCLACGDVSGRVRPINRAFDAVTELSLSLDFEQGGEMAQRLAELYGYISQKIIVGHANQSDDALAEAARLLTTMHESWERLASA